MIEDIHTCLLNKKETCLRLFVSIMTSVIALLVAESSIAYDLDNHLVINANSKQIMVNYIFKHFTFQNKIPEVANQHQ